MILLYLYISLHRYGSLFLEVDYDNYTIAVINAIVESLALEFDRRKPNRLRLECCGYVIEISKISP